MTGDLTKDEQEHVRAAIRFMLVRFGKAALMAKALRCQTDSLRKALSGHDVVSASLALRMARLAQVGVDDMLAGNYPVKGMCPHCGHVQNGEGPRHG